MTKAKSLTVARMKKADAKAFAGQTKITVQGYEVIIDKELRTTKIQELVVEIFEDIDELRKRGIEIDKFDINGYALFQMIKHFTNIDIPEKLEDKLAIFNIMLDNHFFHPIVNAFGDQVKAVDAVLSSMVDDMATKTAELKEKIASEVAKMEAELQDSGEPQGE